MKTLTEEDSGKEITLGLNEKLKVVLDENPTTGYTWQWKGETRVMSLLRSRSLGGGSERIGGARRRDFLFVSRGRGSISLQLLYLRPWEEGKPARDFSVRVNVEGGKETR